MRFGPVRLTWHVLPAAHLLQRQHHPRHHLHCAEDTWQRCDRAVCMQNRTRPAPSPFACIRLCGDLAVRTDSKPSLTTNR
jgi:hypothetical protein